MNEERMNDLRELLDELRLDESSIEEIVTALEDVDSATIVDLVTRLEDAVDGVQRPD